jgi:hypothetical protein
VTGRPDLGTVADWVEGRLDAERARQVAAAVAADPELQAHADWLRALLAAAAAMPLQAPPPAVSDRLTDVFDDYLRRQRPAASGPVLRATLVFDSRRDVALAGVRGAASDEIVHLAYAVDLAMEGAASPAVLDVVVDAEPLHSGRVRVSGQVLPSDVRAVGAVAVTAVADAADEPLAAAVTDALGRFDLGEVADTVAELRLSAPYATVVAPLALRAGR